MKKNTMKLNEAQLSRIVAECMKKVLRESADNLYICSETDYNGGKVDYWVGDENDAKYCESCSEANAIGPFPSMSALKDYAQKNGLSNQLSESKLRKIVTESMKKVLKEEIGKSGKSGNLSNHLGSICSMAKYLQQKSFEMDKNGDADGKDELYTKVFPIMRDLWVIAHSYGY